MSEELKHFALKKDGHIFCVADSRIKCWCAGRVDIARRNMKTRREFVSYIRALSSIGFSVVQVEIVGSMLENTAISAMNTCCDLDTICSTHGLAGTKP